VEKQIELAKLANRRKEARWPRYCNLADYHCGVFECEFVSPYTKSAGNVDSPIFVLLQDWVSDEYLRAPINADTLRLGYTPDMATNRNLESRLSQHFRRSIRDVYGTNLFPFIKPGGMSSRIPWNDLVRAAEEYALPQVEIVKPLLVIALGLSTFQAMRRVVTGSAGPARLAAAIENPFDHGEIRFWCQAHTGWGVSKRGSDGTERDWVAMAEWFYEALNSDPV